MKLLADKAGLPIEYFRGDGPALPRSRAASPAAFRNGGGGFRWSLGSRRSRPATLAELSRPGGERMETDCKDPNCFVLVVEGDSMEPLALAGDLVVIAPGSEPRNGDLVVCRLKDDRMLFRRYQRRGPEGRTIRLESANPAYQPMEFAAREIACVYPAVGVEPEIQELTVRRFGRASGKILERPGLRPCPTIAARCTRGGRFACPCCCPRRCPIR